MLSFLKRTLKPSFARGSITLAARWPFPWLLKQMRKFNAIQLSSAELQTIAACAKKKRPCNLLVFGLGNDSAFWSKINRGGKTVFIEDDEAWFRRVLDREHHLAAHRLDYGTRRIQWQELIECPDRLWLDHLPDEIAKEKWDIVLVDAPAGGTDVAPGRMKSIFLSSQLTHASSDVFVHDCDRPVECAYCDRFLKEENRVVSIDRLRHYHLKTSIR